MLDYFGLSEKVLTDVKYKYNNIFYRNELDT